MGLLAALDPANMMGDRGYIGTGILTPYRKPAGNQLLPGQEEFSTSVSELRYVIERAIANFAAWRCMHTDYRRPLAHLHHRLPRCSSPALLQTGRGDSE
ncbi:MAG: transposase family protein [Actinomycetes bacterium]